MSDIILNYLYPGLITYSPKVGQKGRWSPPFPVHIECRTSDSAKAILGLQESILASLAKHDWQDQVKLAEVVRAIPEFSNILEGTTSEPWWVVLNGIDFKGILLSEK